MLTLSSSKLFKILSLNLLILFLITINKSSVNGKVLTQVEKHHHHDHQHRHHHQPSTDQQQSTLPSTKITTIKPTFYVGIGPWVKHDEITSTTTDSTPTIKKRVNKNNQQLKSSSSQESILIRSNQPTTQSNPTVNHHHVNNKIKSSTSPSPVEYGFNDQDYPYIIGKTDNLDEGRPRISGKVGRDEDNNGRYQDEFKVKEDEKYTRGLRDWDRDESPISTTEQSMFGARSGRSSFNPSSSSPTPKGASDDEDSTHESSDFGIKYFNDKSNTKNEDKYYSPPDYNFRESGPMKKSTNSYGSSPSAYSSPRSSSSSSSSSGPSSEANYDDYTDGSSSSSGRSEGSSSSDSDEPSSSSYNSDEPSYSKSLDENEKQSTKSSAEPSYNYRGSDDYLSSKSSSSSPPPPTTNNDDNESTNYYKPSQGYDDYAEGQTNGDGGQDDDGKQSESDGESDRYSGKYKEDNKYKEKPRKQKGKSSSSSPTKPPPTSTSSPSYYKKQDTYKPDESYDENDDDSGSAGPADYNNYGKSDFEKSDDHKISSNYDEDKPESKSRSNEEEEFDAAFKEPLTDSNFNFHQQESRAIKNFANNKQNKSITKPGKLIKPKSVSLSPSPYLSTSPPQPKKLTSSRNYIKPKDGANSLVSATILVN